MKQNELTPNEITLTEEETQAIVERAHFESDFSLLNTPHLRQQFIRLISRPRFNELADMHFALEAAKNELRTLQTLKDRRVGQQR